jgi:hypothetical protein
MVSIWVGDDNTAVYQSLRYGDREKDGRRPTRMKEGAAGPELLACRGSREAIEQLGGTYR